MDKPTAKVSQKVRALDTLRRAQEEAQRRDSSPIVLLALLEAAVVAVLGIAEVKRVRTPKGHV